MVSGRAVIRLIKVEAHSTKMFVAKQRIQYCKTGEKGSDPLKCLFLQNDLLNPEKLSASCIFTEFRKQGIHPG